MKVKKITALIMSFALLMLCLSGCAIKGEPVEETTVIEEDTIEFLHDAGGEQLGKTQSIIVHEKDYAYGIHYPETGIYSIDSEIKKEAQSFADDFIQRAKGYRASDANSKAVLTVDYKTYLVKMGDENRIISVVFNLREDMPQLNSHNEKAKTMCFDAHSKKLLYADLAFSDGFEKQVSRSVIKYFINNRLYADKTDTKDFKNYTSPDKLNFTAFIFKSEDIVFYFDGNTLFPDEKECTQAIVPLKDLEDFLSENVKKLYEEEKKESDTQTETSTKKEQASKPQNIKLPDFTVPANLPAGKKYIAFTFDDGPANESTNRILDVLQKYNWKATFFVLGNRASSYQSSLKRASAMGCEIGNHSYSHAKLTDLSNEERIKEINRTNDIVKDITGKSPTLFRAPYGAYKGIEKDVGMPLIQWTIDTNDWRYKDRVGLNRTPQERERDKHIIMASVLDHVVGGEIVLMHDIYNMTAESFEEMAPILKARGFELVTVTELYKINGKTLENGVVYRGIK